MKFSYFPTLALREAWFALDNNHDPWMNMDWLENLLNMGLGGLPKAAAGLCPDHLKRQWLARLGDNNPFKTISANRDPLRATRLAWIEAAQSVIDKARVTANTPEWQSNAATIAPFDATITKTLLEIRDQALDRRTDPAQSPIDIHVKSIASATAPVMVTFLIALHGLAE